MDAKDYIPFCEDQGMPTLAGAFAKGVSVQHKIFAMVTAPDDFVFADNDLEDMADATYVVLAQNQTDVSKPPAMTAKSVSQFTITGPAIGDDVDLIIVGKLKGQL